MAAAARDTSSLRAPLSRMPWSRTRPGRTVVLVRTARLPALPPRRRLAILLAAAALGYAVLFAAALLGGQVAFVVAAAYVVAVEPAFVQLAPIALWGSREAQLGLPWRWSVQAVALLCLASHTATSGTSPASSAPVVLAVVAVAVVGLLAGVLELAAQAVELLRKSALLGRNLDLGALSVPRAPVWLLTYRGMVLLPAQLGLLVVGAVATVAAGTPRVTAAVVTALAVMVLAALAVVALAVLALRVARRSNPRRAVPAAVERALADLAPEVLLYYGGHPDALYQVQMWLKVLAHAPQRTLVVLRDTESLRLLAPTSLPVLCVPSAPALMNLELPMARGALFVANAANNAHLLRRRGLTSAFIGHGDSDKAASSSPFLKVYDQLWVAGPAAAGRFADLNAPQLASRIREVGRPQAVVAHMPRSAPIRTVLYAPTWEGWGDQQHSSSLQRGGVELVTQLLAAPGVRLVYRPHPLTGSRDRVVRRAHEQILQLLYAAGTPASDGSPFDSRPDAGSDSGSHTGSGAGAGGRLDDLDLMLERCRAAPRTGPRTALRTAPAQEKPGTETPVEEPWVQAFWAGSGAEVPRIASADRLGLAEVFAHTDVLVADVSSVVSDWMVVDRPFAIVLPPHLSKAEFVGLYPTASAGDLLDAEGAGLTALLADLAAGRDPNAARRHTLRSALLGAEPEAAQQRFERALTELVVPTAPTTTTFADPDLRQLT